MEDARANCGILEAAETLNTWYKSAKECRDTLMWRCPPEQRMLKSLQFGHGDAPLMVVWMRRPTQRIISAMHEANSHGDFFLMGLRMKMAYRERLRYPAGLRPDGTTLE